MAITGATTATVVADAVLTEMINREMRFAVQSPFLFQDFVYLPPTLQNTKRWSVPIYANLTASAAYTETDTVDAQALTPTAVDIDTALFATGAFIGDWGNTLAVQPLVPGAVQALMDACMRKLETDSLALGASMSNSIGSAATTMSVDNFVTVVTTIRTNGKRCSRKPMMVLSESAKRDLHADSMKNGGGIYGSIIGVQLHQAVSGANQGEWTEWGGFMIASTDGIPTADTTGKGNFVVHMAPGEYALGMAFSMDIRIEPARKAEALGLYLIASHAHGAGICEQARALRFITKA